MKNTSINNKPRRWKVFQCPKCPAKLKVLTEYDWLWEWCPNYKIKVYYKRFYNKRKVKP